MFFILSILNEPWEVAALGREVDGEESVTVLYREKADRKITILFEGLRNEA